MNILRRAWWGVSRRGTQSLFLFLILLAIGTLVIASLYIQAASEKAKLDARKGLGSEVTVMNNRDVYNGFHESLPISVAQSIIQNEYVDGYNYYTNLYFAAISFNAVPGETSDRVEIEVTGDVPDNFKMPDVQVFAITDTSRLKEFKNGVHTLVEGRHITEDITGGPFILIEQTLANQNDINVGDKLILNSFQAELYEMEVVGIYHTKETMEDARINNFMPIVTTVDSPYNRIYANANANVFPYSSMHKLILYLNDPDNISSFIEQEKSNPLIDLEMFKFYTNEDQFKKMSLIIDQVASFSNIMLWLILICGALILCLLFIYFAKGRLREMGVLLSLGEGRLKLILQLIIETLILVIIAFSISIFTGHIVASQTSAALLEQQQAEIEKKQQLQMQGAVMLNGSSDGQIGVISAINIKLSSDIWLKLIYVTFFILLISMAYPILIIFKLKPTTILSLQE